MQDFRPYIKKFLLLYIIAVTLVLLYFVLKILFSEEKVTKQKHFNTVREVNRTKINSKESLNNETPQEQNRSKPFLLLPQQ